jgi:hypothetical protein
MKGETHRMLDQADRYSSSLFRLPFYYHLEHGEIEAIARLLLESNDGK